MNVPAGFADKISFPDSGTELESSPPVDLSLFDELRGESVVSKIALALFCESTLIMALLLERATESSVLFKSEAQTVGINNNIIRKAKNIIMLF